MLTKSRFVISNSGSRLCLQDLKTGEGAWYNLTGGFDQLGTSFSSTLLPVNIASLLYSKGTRETEVVLAVGDKAGSWRLDQGYRQIYKEFEEVAPSYKILTRSGDGWVQYILVYLVAADNPEARTKLLAEMLEEFRSPAS